MVLNLYATRDDLKARVGLSDTDDDSILDLVLASVSREIDSWCGRQFFASVGTRYFTPAHCDHIMVDDLLSVTTIKTDEDGDRTYPTTWATTDYDLQPRNAAQMSPAQPYWYISAAPLGRYGWPQAASGVQIVGRWGYYDVLQTSTATLAEDLDTTEPAVDVSSGAAFRIGQVIEIDSERMEISAISTNTLTVSRAVNGTTAAAHTNGAAIRVATFPLISEACLHQATLEFRGINAPLGVQGSPEFGQTIRAVGLHPFVQNMLRPFRTPRLA